MEIASKEEKSKEKEGGEKRIKADDLSKNMSELDRSNRFDAIINKLHLRPLFLSTEKAVAVALCGARERQYGWCQRPCMRRV
jgi:hypothetical protein